MLLFLVKAGLRRQLIGMQLGAWGMDEVDATGEVVPVRVPSFVHRHDLQNVDVEPVLVSVCICNKDWEISTLM